jgi:hypothetical protein
VDECIREGILERVLRANRAEVTNMLFKEYDSAAHIASEKDISYEEGLKAGIKEGRRDEQKNTAREKQRADNLEVENRVLVYNAQGKSKEDIAQLCNKPLEYIDSILNKYHIC